MGWLRWLAAAFAATAASYYVVILFGLVGLVLAAAVVLLAVGVHAARQAPVGRRWAAAKWWIFGGLGLVLAWAMLALWRIGTYLAWW